MQITIFITTVYSAYFFSPHTDVNLQILFWGED